MSGTWVVPEYLPELIKTAGIDTRYLPETWVLPDRIHWYLPLATDTVGVVPDYLSETKKQWVAFPAYDYLTKHPLATTTCYTCKKGHCKKGHYTLSTSKSTCNSHNRRITMGRTISWLCWSYSQQTLFRPSQLWSDTFSTITFMSS